jgi:hypothetical protein
MASFDEDLRTQLRERAIRLDEAERQVAMLNAPPPYSDLVRPATIGDGIERLAEEQRETLVELARDAACAGRLAKFVPASGAATRMFQDLLHFHRGPGRGTPWREVRRAQESGDAAAGALVAVVERASELPFSAAWDEALARGGHDRAGLVAGGDYPRLLAALLDDLGLAGLPKGLLPFHADEAGVGRTPVEEHVAEAAELVADAAGICRLHFTVAPEHRAGFEDVVRRLAASLAGRGIRLEVGYSQQSRATDTLAVDEEGNPFVLRGGRLLFRPGGHGALIENLGALDADLVFVKNIDNVQPERLRPQVVRWKRLLAGRLIALQAEAFELERRLRESDAAESVPAALAFIRERLYVVPGVAAQADPRAWALDRLRRPLRVCGMVRNQGEPGGGPFWVRDASGDVGLQIVELAQVDTGRDSQRSIVENATHFNPVDLVCALRDAEGRRHRLSDFVDAGAVIVGRKSAEGRPLRSLERPGLWNGAMAGWNTVFVEVPLETFSPVKSVVDLLRPEHRS